MSEAFEYFSKLIDRQAVRSHLPSCACGRQPTTIQDRISGSWWVGCRVIRTTKGLSGCGRGFFAKTEDEAIQQWKTKGD